MSVFIRNSMEEAHTQGSKKMECVEVTAEEEVTFKLRNTGTFCCRQCGVFDLNGYRNRLTPQLGCIAEEEEVSDSDLVEEDAILGVLRKAPVVECFHCAQASDLAAAAALGSTEELFIAQPEEEAEPRLQAEEIHMLALEEEAALLMLNELQKSLGDEEAAIEEGSIVALEDAVVEKSSVSWEKSSINLLDGFYSYEDVDVLEQLDAEVERSEVERREVASFMSSACDEMDLESLCESLKDIASEDSDVESDVESRFGGKTLFDVETGSVASSAEYASVQSAEGSERGASAARDFASYETARAHGGHGAGVYLRLSSFADEHEYEAQRQTSTHGSMGMERSTTLNNQVEEELRASVQLRAEAVQALETKTALSAHAAHVHLAVPALEKDAHAGLCASPASSSNGKLLKLHSNISNVSTCCDDVTGSMSFDSSSTSC